MKKQYLSILLISLLLLVACTNNPANPAQDSNSAESTTPVATTPVASSSDPGQVIQATVGLALPFDLQWGMSLEDCASKFQNDWTLQESASETETSYALNQKQTLYEREGTVILSFSKRPDAAANVPSNLLTLPDQFLTGVTVTFENPVDEINAELVKQYGQPLSTEQIGTIVRTSFSSSQAQVKNITNENQKKAYHLYRYVVMQDYRDLQECIQTPQETILEHQNLYTTNPDEVWNQIQGWNFDDGEHYLNSITLTNNTESPNGCAVVYNIGDLLYLLNVQ